METTGHVLIRARGWFLPLVGLASSNVASPELPDSLLSGCSSSSSSRGMQLSRVFRQPHHVLTCVMFLPCRPPAESLSFPLVSSHSSPPECFRSLSLILSRFFTSDSCVYFLGFRVSRFLNFFVPSDNCSLSISILLLLLFQLHLQP